MTYTLTITANGQTTWYTTSTGGYTYTTTNC